MYFGYIFVCLFLFETQIGESKLVSLFVIHRHADRSPVISYPTDPYACHWKEGLGVLSQVGIQRMKDFGKIYRQKYGNFWPVKSDVKVRSSRVDRVIKSTKALLDGVYSDDFLFNPIPIDAKPTNEDNMLFPIVNNCDKYREELVRVFKSHENVAWFNSQNKLWSHLAKNSGENITKLDPADRLQIVNFQDTFLVQRRYKLKLPPWMTDSVYDQFHAASIKETQIIYSTTLLQRLSSGLIFNEVRKQMEAIKKGKHADKVHIYATHDVKLASMLMAMKAFNGKLVPYGTSIVFEFHSNEKRINDHRIKTFYLNDTSTAKFHPLKVAGCSEHSGCSFDEFNTLVKDLIPVDWSKECASK